MNPTEPNQKPGTTSMFEVVRSFVFILITIGVAYYVTVSVGIDSLRETVLGAGLLGPLIIVLLKATTIVVAPLGGTPIYPISGALFGFWQGLGWVLLGDLLGATIAFYLSRFFGRSIIKFFVGRSQVPVVESLVSKGIGIKTLLKTRFFLAGFPEAFPYAFGLTTVSYPVFITIHMIFHIITDALLVMFGDLVVSADLTIVIATGLVSLLLAFIGVKLLKIDLLKNS